MALYGKAKIFGHLVYFCFLSLGTHLPHAHPTQSIKAAVMYLQALLYTIYFTY